MSTLAPERALHLDDVLDFMNALDAEPNIPCDWGCSAPATHQVKYEPCNHSHVICARHAREVEHRQAVADDATPPRPYSPKHKHCGQVVWRAVCRRL